MIQLSGGKKKLLGLDILLFALLLALDQATKRAAVARLKGEPPYPILPGVLELHYLENHGAAFGLLQEQKVFLILIAALILFFITYILLVMPDGRRYLALHPLLSMLSAGAVGNMIDRVLHGYVVDFISFVIIHFPIFNVADIYVTVSTFALMFLFLFYYREQDLNFLGIRHRERFRELK